MKRSSFLVCAGVLAVSACSYYDTSLLKFSVDEPIGGQGGSVSGGQGGVASGAGGAAGTSGGAAGTNAGAAGIAGAAGATAGAAGIAGAAGSAGTGAAGTGGTSGASGVAGSGGGGEGGTSSACVRAVVPTRPLMDSVGGAGGVAAGGAAGAAGKAGGSSGGAAGATAGAGGVAGAAGNPAISSPDNLIFAVRMLDFGESVEPSKSTVGFDLDGSCTCLDAPGEVCKPWQVRSPLCDGPGGRDNSFPRLLKTLVSFGYGQNSAQMSQTLEDGSFTLILRVQNWNLLPNDAEVSVSFYTSSGAAKKPEWNGKDVWDIVENSVANGSIDQPVLRDTTAYVSDGNLVASLPTFDANDKKVLIQLNERFGLALSGARIVGKIDQLLGAYRILGGTLSGTWRDRDFFTQVATIKDPLDASKTVCTDNLLYPQVKAGFCDIADLAGNAADLSGVCASSSIAMTFNAQEARLGAITPLLPPGGSTCPAATDPSQDGCAKK